jgi:hypothetical protein
MKTIYLATTDDKIPSVVADNLQRFEELLFEYFGYPNDQSIEFKGFFPFDNCGYPDIYEGYYEFITPDYGNGPERIVEKMHRYYLNVNEL